MSYLNEKERKKRIAKVEERIEERIHERVLYIIEKLEIRVCIPEIYPFYSRKMLDISWPDNCYELKGFLANEFFSIEEKLEILGNFYEEGDYQPADHYVNYLSFDRRFNPEYMKKDPTRTWRMDVFYNSPNFNLGWVKKYSGGSYKWEIKPIVSHPNVTWEMILKNREMLEKIVVEEDDSIEFIFITRNSNFTDQTIERCPELLHHLEKYYQENPKDYLIPQHVSWKYLECVPRTPHGLSKLSQHPAVTPQIVKENPVLNYLVHHKNFTKEDVREIFERNKAKRISHNLLPKGGQGKIDFEDWYRRHYYFSRDKKYDWENLPNITRPEEVDMISVLKNIFSRKNFLNYRKKVEEEEYRKHLLQYYLKEYLGNAIVDPNHILCKARMRGFARGHGLTRTLSEDDSLLEQQNLKDVGQ